MQIRNSFDVPLAPPDAWSFLMNIPETVACFPAAELVEQVDENNYKGRVTVKLGPLTMVFNGRISIEDRNDEGRSAKVKAVWNEAKGRGNANTVTRFTLNDRDDGTGVELETDVQLAGQIAQYGRGTAMISDVATQLIGKFAENLHARINQNALEHTQISGLSLASRALLNRFKRPAEN